MQQWKLILFTKGALDGLYTNSFCVRNFIFLFVGNIPNKLLAVIEVGTPFNAI